jgi:hypothetical protein
MWPSANALLGDDFEAMIGNLAQNLHEGRADVVLAGFRKP